LIHDLLSLTTKGSFLRNLRSKHVPCSLEQVINRTAYRRGIWNRLTRWHAQYFSFILGACVPLPKVAN
jgi:hypothetical protein